jgi:hypothetical protein
LIVAANSPELDRARADGLGAAAELAPGKRITPVRSS